ncbi:MAG: hypothetical protein ACRDGM_04615 [bacterium]
MLAAARMAEAGSVSRTFEGFFALTAGIGASFTTLALSSAYTYASAGAGYGARVVLPTNKTLATVLYYLSAMTGTAANVNDINFELRNDSSGLPGSTLHTSAVADPNGDASATGWHSLNPADFAMVAGTVYWPIIADADGNSTDFATCIYRGSSVAINRLLITLPFTTANGWVAGSSVGATNPIPVLVLVFTDGTVLGCSLTSQGTVTSDTNRRGAYLNAAFTEKLTLIGFNFSTGTSTITGGELYDSTTLPGGTPLASSIAVYPATVTEVLFAPYALAKTFIGRLVVTYGSASGNPQKYSIGTDNGHTTQTRLARPGGGKVWFARANGTTDWSNDDQDGLPTFTLYFEDQVVIPTTGGAHVIGG